MTTPLKYDPLGEFLRHQDDVEITLSFEEIEKLVGPLPEAALTPQFWSNAKNFHRSRRQWLSNGYEAFFVNEAGGPAVRFHRQNSRASVSGDALERGGKSWTDAELKACVEVYHDLLEANASGEPLSKAAVRNRVLVGPLNGRSKSSYEYRMQNISAVLEELGLEILPGYPPLKHVGSVLSRIITLINDAWHRIDVPELPTSDPDKLKSRIISARQKRQASFSVAVPPGNRTVTFEKVLITRPKRDASVAEWILGNSKGCCEACGEAAPFTDSEGEPFLEIHHVRWLSHGGPDTTNNAIACCPNCHRRFHHGKEYEKFRRQTLARIARLIDHPKIVKPR